MRKTKRETKLPASFADADEYLAHLVRERAPKRYPGMTEKQRTRVQSELDAIKETRFADRMLIAQDVVVWAKEHGVPVGPGRGSVACSAVAYVLGVIDVDPMEHGLPFERFLNPALSWTPDIGVDVSDRERPRVVDHIAERHGRDCVGRPVPDGGPDDSLVFIAPAPLRESAQLVPAPDGGTPLVRCDRARAAELGFAVVDIRGERALSIIADACETIRANRGVELDMGRLDLTDTETFRLFREGRTEGVFLFGSAEMQDSLRQLKPTALSELIAMYALLRPGSMDSIPSYIERKNRLKPFDCVDPRFEPILGETCGLIVYQEQIMELAREAAGFSLGEGDVLRRAMAKKKGVERFEGRFKDGAARRGFSRETAERLWDELLRAAANAFPKAHSTAYALIAFQTAFLKAHYPGEFAIALGESDNRI